MCGNHVLFEEFRVNLHTKSNFNSFSPCGCGILQCMWRGIVGKNKEKSNEKNLLTFCCHVVGTVCAHFMPW